MFYSETILSRRGPLGRVWLAAHMERKLSKSQTLQTDIEQSVEAIMGQEIEVMALRLSGQLLLGVVRIYSRKAKYLLDDCNEALLKIKMAFRPGVVDLTEDQLTVNKTAITLQTNGLGLDLLLPDVDWDMDFEDRPLQHHGHHQAHVDDITLRTADDYQLGISDPFDIGPSDGIGSQDFNDLDLGIQWDDERNDKSEMMSLGGSVGMGREAQDFGNDIEPALLGEHGLNMDLDILSHRSKSRNASEQPFAAGMEIDTFPEVDLGDLGIGFGNPPDDFNNKTPSQTRSPSRASSPLTDVPVTPPPGHQTLDGDVGIAASSADKPKRKMKDKKQIIDSVTELQNGIGLPNNRGGTNSNPLNMNTAGITSTHHFLPKSSIVMKLLEIREDPVNYFLPIQAKTQGTFFIGGPPGLIPELAELFSKPASNISIQKRKAPSPEASPSKRLRRDEVELPRRVASVPPGEDFLGVVDQSTLDIDAGFNFADQSGALDDFQLDMAEAELDLDQHRAKSVFTDRSRLSSVVPEGVDDEPVSLDVTCPISVFDVSQASQSQAAETEQEVADVPGREKHGYSKNTVKALSLVRRELQPQPTPDSRDEQDQKTVNFQRMANKASRRAAASFFFELLVLSTRDCLKVSQQAPFADIKVRAKPRLWEHQQYIHADTTAASAL
ncbi:Rec8 like protein-domain-containing protein [Gymnopilus junonius]|uniref:Rec8 like protein-domain-containing protein n=1 Tax=Gymnopilus junonius TaxID=109634 RepID=A0A9P5NMU3_GYMJU|nr:Rec8 like protein-domain-containing protein [Gymnopilus junonius]